MNTIEVLEEVKSALARGEVTREDLLGVLKTIEQGTVQMPGTFSRRKFRLAEVLYFIGGAIVVIGVSVLIGQHWQELNSVTRIIATLGVSIATYITATLFHRSPKTENVGQAFYLISAITLPLGLGVVFHEAGYQVSTLLIQTIIGTISFVMFLVSVLVMKRPILLIFSVIYGVLLFFISTSFLTQGLPNFQNNHFTEYRFLATGVTLSLLGYAWSHGKYKQLSGVLYAFGSVTFLGSALSLGGFKPSQNVFWEIIYPGLAFGVIIISIPLRSKSFLTFGSLFLMAYIIKITSEYFSDSLGWPLALVIAGLCLMGIGYLSVFVNRRYLSRSSSSLPSA